MRQAFWMVLGKGLPVFRHPDETGARREAERLAREYPGEEFVVLQSVATVRKSDISWEDHDPEFQIPF